VPEELKPITAELVQRVQKLVGDLEVDLDAPLRPDQIIKQSAPQKWITPLPLRRRESDRM